MAVLFLYFVASLPYMSIQKTDVSLQGDKVLADLTAVKGCPKFQIDVVVQSVNLGRIGDPMLAAHDVKGPGGGVGKIEERIVSVKEQVEIVHGTGSFLVG